jgi:tetratricopeptide (TPR) repeat protein
LSNFEDVSVISWFVSSRYIENGGDVDRISENFGVSYLISGRIQISETDLTVTLYLNEPLDPMPIWSHIFTQSIENQSIFEVIREITERIISMLVDYNGYIHVHRYGARDFASLPSNKTSLAIFWFYHFVTRNTSEIYFEALQHLEVAVKEDPNSPIAWAILGHMQFNGLIYGYVIGEETIELSRLSIEKALMLNPDSQHGLIGLSLLKLLKGETEEASNLLQRCIEVNPNSGYFQATVSLGFTMVGKYKEAIELLKKAYGSNAIPIWWLSISEYLEALVSGDYKSALQLAPRYHAAGILQHVFELIALYHLGEQNEFEKLTEYYVEKYPEGILHVRDKLLKLFNDPKAHEKFKSALDAAADYLHSKFNDT